MPMTRWELRIVSCLAGGNASATCLKMLVMRFADVPLHIRKMQLHIAIAIGIATCASKFASAFCSAL